MNIDRLYRNQYASELHAFPMNMLYQKEDLVSHDCIGSHDEDLTLRSGTEVLSLLLPKFLEGTGLEGQ